MREVKLIAFCGAIAIVAVVSARAQDSPRAQRPSGPMARETVTPYTEETLETDIRTTKDGKTTTTEIRNLTAEDSQGRRVFVMTNLNAGLTMTTVDDPVKAVRMVWSSAHSVVQVLHNAVAVPGRKSCWKVEREPFESNDQAQIGTSGFGCFPAEKPMPYGSCSAPSPAAPPVRPRTVRAAPGQADCEISFRSVHLLDANQKAEDLGDAVIAGWPAHGCRIGSESPKGHFVYEVWMTALPPDNTIRPTVRSFREKPLPSGETLKTTTQMEVLQGGEPDESMFEPPRDYEQKTLALTEVPCDPTAPPNVVGLANPVR